MEKIVNFKIITPTSEEIQNTEEYKALVAKIKTMVKTEIK